MVSQVFGSAYNAIQMKVRYPKTLGEKSEFGKAGDSPCGGETKETKKEKRAQGDMFFLVKLLQLFVIVSIWYVWIIKIMVNLCPGLMVLAVTNSNKDNNTCCCYFLSNCIWWESFIVAIFVKLHWMEKFYCSYFLSNWFDGKGEATSRLLSISTLVQSPTYGVQYCINHNQQEHHCDQNFKQSTMDSGRRSMSRSTSRNMNRSVSRFFLFQNLFKNCQQV